LLDICRQNGFGEQVVDWDIKEPLDLGSVQVECDDMVGSGDGEQIRNQPVYQPASAPGLR